MFRKAKNIDTAFRQMRLFSFAVLGVCLVICSVTIYFSIGLVSNYQNKVYVLANNKALEAYASDRKENIPVEAKEHIRTFHKLFFTLSPDEKMIQQNMRGALYLADESAKQQYDNLKESNYFIQVIAGNINQVIEVDSIDLDLSAAPFHFTCMAKQVITRPTTVVTRSLITQGQLREVQRSEHNPHGFLIERWKIIENRDLIIKNR